MTGAGILTVLLLTTAAPGPGEPRTGWATESGLRVATLLAASGDPAVAPVEEELHRAQLMDAQRKLKIATAGSLLLTGTLGTLLALNRETLLWDGRCSTPDRSPIP